ncbi:MAG TPA: hypothetical protein VHT30_03665 [Acidimicrobiales bacterium]|nr:hypothetical protein [Acidimicrobiales bacterium]
MGTQRGRRALEWARAHNPGATQDLWLMSHTARMYALGVSSRWLQPAARFVIVTPGRSGSELLTDLLNSHPSITCDAEILRERMAWPQQFVAGRAAKAALAGAEAYGFKVHCGHFGYQVLRERPGYVAQLAADGTQVILLRRENLLAQAVSSTIANRTRWHWRRRDEAVFEPMELDPVEVLMMAYLFEESDRYLESLLSDVPHLVLSYERDLVDSDAQEATVRRICGCLGLDHQSVSSDHVRFTPRSLRATIGNYDAVARVIGATRFGRFLDDDGEAAADRFASGGQPRPEGLPLVD